MRNTQLEEEIMDKIIEQIYYLYDDSSKQWIIKILGETVAAFDSEEQCFKYLYGHIHEV
jgi:hypothetical protein